MSAELISSFLRRVCMRCICVLSLVLSYSLTQVQGVFAQKLSDHNTSTSESPISESSISESPTSESPTSETLDEDSATIIVKEKSNHLSLVKQGQIQLRDQLNSSGVWGVMSGGEGSRLEVQIRGAGGHQSGVYLDDIPLHSLRGQSVDLSLFPLDLLSAVDVSRGGDGTADGSGELGGRVRLLTPEIPVGQRARWTLGGSTQGWGRIGALWGRGEQNERGGTSGGLLSISLSGGPNEFPYQGLQGDNRRRSLSGFNRVSFLAKGKLTHHKHHVKMSAGGGYLSRGEPGPEGLSLPGRESQQSVWWGSTSDQWSHALKHGRLLGHIHLTYLRLNYRFQEQVPLWQSQEYSEVQFLDQRVGMSARMTWAISNLKLGSVTQVSLTRAVTQRERAGREQAGFTPYLELNLTPRLKVKWATRIDLNTERTPRVVSNTKLAWVSHRRLPWKFWLAWSQVWRDPGFDERFLNGPGLVANPRLSPEEGQWGELGISKSERGLISSHRWRGTLTLRAFGQYYDQMISYVPLDPYRIRAENLTGAEILGLESGFNISLSVDHLRFSLSGEMSALRHQTVHEPKAPLPLRPQKFAYVRLGLSEQQSRGEVGGWIKLSGRGAITVDRFGERSLPSRNLWSLGLNRRWVISEVQWRVHVRLDNVFNIPSYDFALHPITGRSIWINLERE